MLFRDTDGDGVPDQKSVFIDHLNSPFGVVLVGSDLYVANTDAVVRYHYTSGQIRITDPGVKLCDLPGGPIDHHWTKSLTASPDGSELYAGVGSNSNITENGIQAELDRASTVSYTHLDVYKRQAEGFRCAEPAAVTSAIRQTLQSSGPAVLEATVDANEKPSLPEELAV